MVGVALVYSSLFLGIAASSGIKYADWLDTADNALRTAVIPLAAGSLLLLGFLAFARWDTVWKDPARLPDVPQPVEHHRPHPGRRRPGVRLRHSSRDLAGELLWHRTRRLWPLLMVPTRRGRLLCLDRAPTLVGTPADPPILHDQRC